MTVAPGTYALPMSPAQQRLWLLDQLDPGTTIFNIPVALRLTGPLDVDALRAALMAAVERHEVLRTTLGSRQGEPTQFIHPASALDLPLQDLSALAPEAREAALLRELRAAAAQPFDLARGPLLRLRLWKLAAQEHTLMIALHHAIADGWSLGVLYRDIGHFYQAHLPGAVGLTNAALPELAIQYADYACWQRERMANGELDRQRDYWQQQLADYPGVLELPTDHPRPASQTFDAGEYPFRFPERLADGLRAFGQDTGATLFMTTITAYALLLSRYSGQQDLCIGIPVAGRGQPELEDLVGFFVNGMAIRFRIGPHDSARTLMHAVQQTVLDGFANQDLSVDNLFESLRLARDPAREPLVQCTFALQNFPRQPQTLPGLDVQPVPVECMHSRYELMLLLTETPEGIVGNMVYNTRLFEHATVARMMEHLVRIAEAMCTAPDAPLSSLSFATPAELYRALRLDPADYERILPLNPMQRDLYMDALAHPDSPQNTVGGAFEIHAEVDPSTWQATLERLTEQQPVLRTRIHASSAPWTEPVYQAILRRDTPRLEIEDWSSRGLEGEALQQALDGFIRRPFPVDGADTPLVRHVLLRLAPARWLAVLVNHHLLLDGVATANALRWLADSHSGREPITLPPGAFHAGLEQRRAGSDTAELLGWWQARLAGVTPPHCPGAARHDPAAPRQRRQFPIAPDLWNGIKRFSRQQRVTPQIFLKAVFSLVADAHGSCPGDLLIQEFVAGRPPGEGEALGCYYQAQPFVASRTLLAGGGSFAALLAHTRDWQKDAGRHGGLSILELRRLAPLGRTTFMFNYITARLEVMVGERPTEILRFTPHADGFVQFEISASGDEVLMSLNYDPARFAETGFLERVQSLSRQLLAADPDRPLSELSWLLPGEGWHTLPAAKPATYVPLSTRIAVQARRTPDAPAVIQGQRRLNYAQLLNAADALTRRLLAAGAGPGERVGICLPRSPDMLIALLAVLQSGGAYVPMDAGYPPERLQRIASDAGCRLILTHANLRPRLLDAGSPLLALDEDGDPSPQEAPSALPERQPGDPFYVLYTSGSTGQPKGAVVGDGAFANLVDWYQRECGIGPADRLFVLSAFGFDLTQKNLWAALCAGAAVVLPESEGFDPERLGADIAAQRTTLVNCAPSAFVALLDGPGHHAALASLRLVVLGGEPIPLARLAPWLGHPDCRAQIINSYGPTECTDVVAWHRLENPLTDLRQEVPMGRPVDHARLHVLDEAGRELPPFGIGELHIGGLCVGQGYWRAPELTQERFVTRQLGLETLRLYRSGDLAYRRGDGLLVYLGRRDFQVKVRGVRIELGEIETALAELVGGDWLVLAANDRITAFVHGTAPPLAELHRRLADRLPPAMLPNAVVAVAAWPLGAHGKVDRQALTRMETEQPAAAIEEPRTPTEQRIARLWREALGRDSIDRRDSFFGIGGHSLLAARIVARLRGEFGIDLPLRALFDHASLHALAAHIDTLQANTQEGGAQESDDLADLAQAVAGLPAAELDALLRGLET